MIRIGSSVEAHNVFARIPELDRYLSLEQLEERLSGEHLVLVAEVDEELAGFKIGYAETEQRFYSWLGGVLTSYRCLGIAQELLEFQESWASVRGFKEISVKSMNRFPSMLRFLIKNGYSIYGIESFDDAEHERILFVKKLS